MGGENLEISVLMRWMTNLILKKRGLNVNMHDMALDGYCMEEYIQAQEFLNFNAYKANLLVTYLKTTNSWESAVMAWLPITWRGLIPDTSV